MKNRIEIKEIDTVVGKVKLIELNMKKTKVVLTNYGAGIVDYIYRGINMVERPKYIDDYLISNAYYGKTIGRTSGRLFPPSFDIDNKTYPIEKTIGDVAHIHGGNDGFSFKFFELVEYQFDGNQVSVTLRYEAKHGLSGYPGNLVLYVIYSLDKTGALNIEYQATTDQDTLCNITNHVYFNLNKDKKNLDNIKLRVNSHKYIKIDENYHPIEIVSLKDTPFDLFHPVLVTKGIKDLVDKGYMGYNNAYLLNEHNFLAVNLFNTDNLINLDIYTNYPSVVIYTHDYPDDKKLLDSQTDGVHGSIAVECQYEPSGIYHKDLNSAILRKDEVYQKYVRFVPSKKKSSS